MDKAEIERFWCREAGLTGEGKKRGGGVVRNVTPGYRTPRPRTYDENLYRSGYDEGRFDAALEEAERTYWRERGFRIDRISGKLVPLESEKP
jgi:hypothetical protein